MSLKSDKILFGDKNLSNLLEDIYNNSRLKNRQIEGMMLELRRLVKTTRDAEIIHPIIKDYLDVAVRNDEALVKIATIAQRILLAEFKEEGEEGFMTDDERRALLEEMNDIVHEAQDVVDKHNIDDDRIEQIKKSLDDDENG